MITVVLCLEIAIKSEIKSCPSSSGTWSRESPTKIKAFYEKREQKAMLPEKFLRRSVKNFDAIR